MLEWTASTHQGEPVRWSNTVGCSQNCWSSSIRAFCKSSSVVNTVLESFWRRCRKICSAGLPFGTARVAERADTCPVASSPHRCDDCPNCPARPRSHPLPTPGADAAGRAPGIGLLRSVTEERRLCPWWVRLRQTTRALSTPLARSKGDVPPRGTSACAAS
jgi:hypothetical protein